MTRVRWLVDATLVLALAVIALGAYTRLTDAGLGCPDWPGCYGRLTPPVHDEHIAAAQARFPAAQVDPFKARNEMVHRYLAGLLGLCVLAIFAVSRRLPRGRGLAAALLALVVLQAALGMWTVTLSLMPVVVVAHLFGGFALLSMLALLRVELGHDRPEPARPAEPGLVRLLPLAWLAVVVLLAQIALGGWTSANYAAAVCHQLPLCESGWSARFSLRAAFGLPLGHETYEFGVLPYEARMSIHVLHRIGALVATAVLASLVLLCRRRAASVRLRRLAAAVGALLVLQVTLGLVNVVGQVPLFNAVAHNLTAACLLAALVLLVRQIRVNAARGAGARGRASAGPSHGGALEGPLRAR
ncbi:COX15/CtaA family protein [Thauera aminoaromatica]|uniref:Heme A synthase n=1 Tax=Thauera aminoaromatica TaxID=164330 RepID=A0A5C7S9N9_THASP|nr:COX15/CtaA family protein [Thauera aminoaromatica]TXH80460.1 MAG: heme A synthase [Thauera aminoaromatica]